LFSPGTPVSSTNKPDHHNITEIFFESGVKHPDPHLFIQKFDTGVVGIVLILDIYSSLLFSIIVLLLFLF
jgi:hypothetical protein